MDQQLLSRRQGFQNRSVGRLYAHQVSSRNIESKGSIAYKNHDGASEIALTWNGEEGITRFEAATPQTSKQASYKITDLSNAFHSMASGEFKKIYLVGSIFDNPMHVQCTTEMNNYAVGAVVAIPQYNWEGVCEIALCNVHPSATANQGDLTLHVTVNDRS